MVDIRIMNVNMRVKDAIQVMANQMGIAPAYQAQNAGNPVKDLGLRIDGLAIQSNKNGLITVTALRDEGNLTTHILTQCKQSITIIIVLLRCTLRARASCSFLPGL